MTDDSQRRRGQALTEYLLLLMIFVSAMLAVREVMVAGFGRAWHQAVGVMQFPTPWPFF
jgi:hypothetical protein